MVLLLLCAVKTAAQGSDQVGPGSGHSGSAGGVREWLQIGYGDNMWNCDTYITHQQDAFDNVIFEVVTKICVLVWVVLISIQIVMIMRQSYQMDEPMGTRLLLYAFRVLVVIMLCSPPLYKAATMGAIATPANLSADAMNAVYLDDMLLLMTDEEQGGFGKIAEDLTTTFKDGLVVTIVKDIIMAFAQISILLAPILQPTLFSVLYILGPFCLSFYLCDLTKDIGETWIRMALAMAWAGFIGSCCFMVGTFIWQVMGFLGAMDNWIVDSVNGLISILLFWMAYPIASTIFAKGASDTTTGHTVRHTTVTRPYGAGVAAAGMTAHAATNVGSRMQRASKGGSAMYRMGVATQKVGDEIRSLFDTTHRTREANSSTAKPRRSDVPE
jgi:hypothetical protein